MRSSQGTAATGGSAQVTSGTQTSSKKRKAPSAEGGEPSAPKAKKQTLEKIPTHLEQKAQSMSMDARVVYQEEILGRCGVQEETIIVDISQLYPPIQEKAMELPIYQVRHIQPYFLTQLTLRMKTVRASPLAAPFVLLVDPKECPTREDFNFAKKNDYHYFVIGGNHSACAKADLALQFPNNKAYRRVQSWIFAGSSVQEARNLAWSHNIDSEFRQQMTTIQRVNYIHLRFVENGASSNQEFKKECATEINLKD